jgi:valyl-tRNA synthetase
VKPRLESDAAPRAAKAAETGGPAAGAARGAAEAVLAYCFDVALRLLHPVVPFITEELWQKLPGREEGELLAVAAWPEAREALIDAVAEARFTMVQDAISAIRNIRAEYRVSPKAQVGVVVTGRTAEARRAFEGERETITRLAQIKALRLDGRRASDAGAHAVLADGSEVFVALAGAIDVQQECRRLSSELTRLDQQLAGLAGKLTNQQFVARAPAEVVAKEREKERAWRDQRQVLADKLKSLGCS